MKRFCISLLCVLTIILAGCDTAGSRAERLYVVNAKMYRTDDGEQLRVEGDVVNSTNTETTFVHVGVQFFDDAGNLIFIRTTRPVPAKIEVGGSSPFVIEAPYDSSITEYDVEAVMQQKGF